MNTINIRFYAELNDFLPNTQRQKSISYPIGIRQTIKDAIEAIGVPHTEVDLILSDGKSVGFDTVLHGEEMISVFPRFGTIDIGPLLKVRPEPLMETKFAVDVHLGRLAGYLRLLGFDTQYDQDFKDEELAHLACGQDRILLTRDRGLLKRSQVRYGYWVRSTLPREQLIEVIARFDLEGSIEIAKRCTHCNELLTDVDKEAIIDRLEPETASYFDSFKQCKGCQRIYWRGSHFDKILQFVAEVRDAVRTRRTQNT